MLDLEGETLTKSERELLQDPLVGGVILFARNCASSEQIAALNREIRDCAPHILIAVDQEGGRVQRVKDNVSLLPPLQRIGDLFVDDAELGLEASSAMGWLMAVEMLALGFDFSFAPVLDVDRECCEVIANRSLSEDPNIVATLGRAYIDGMRRAGMAATAKHFPGHGSVVDDSHLALPVDQRTYDQVVQRDLVPFVELNQCYHAVMPGHLLFPNIDKQPVGFSEFWIKEVLRGRLDFEGVVFSDDLTMKGAESVGGYPQRAEAALNADCDMVLVCNQPNGALEVLDYMRASSVPGDAEKSSARLEKMRVTPNNLGDYREDKRYRRSLELLELLSD